MTARDEWQVQLPSGDILTVTLDQLDSAFADGHVTEATLVREAGTTAWQTLGQMAGLAPPPPSGPVPVGYDPFVVPTPGIPLAPTSMSPMSLDFEVDHPMVAPKKKPVALVMGICGACALLILAAVGLGGASASPAAASTAKTESHLAAAPTPMPGKHIVAAAPAPVAEAAPHLSEAQKKAVALADKKLKAKASTKANKRPLPGKPAKDPFVKGGNKHDPLNKSF